MKTFLTALAAATLLAGPAFAQKETATSLFSDICLDTGLDPVAINAAARDHGFVMPPDQLRDEFLPAEFEGADFLWKMVDRGMYLVMSGTIVFDETTGISGDVCAAVTHPMQSGVMETLGEMLDVGAPSAMDGREMYAFRIKDGERIGVDPESASGLALMMAGELLMATAEQNADDNMSVVMMLNLDLAGLLEAAALEP